MIEQILYFALGALVAGLLALVALPAFWRRAVRLARERLERVRPLSLEEIVAAADLERAAFATDRRRLEQRMERAAAAHAADRVELGQRAIALATLETALDTLGAAHADLATDHAELARAHRAAEAALAATAVELHDAIGLHQRLRGDNAELARTLVETRTLAADRAALIAALDARAQSLQLSGETLAQDVDDLSRAARIAEERLQRLNAERDGLAKDVRHYEQRMAQTLARLENEQARASQMGRRLDAMRAERDSAAERGKRDQEMLRACERARDAAHARLTAAAAALDDQRRAAHETENAAAARLEAAKAEIAALNGALLAARERRTAAGETARLRAALAEIGEKVARMADGGAPAPNP